MGFVYHLSFKIDSQGPIYSFRSPFLKLVAKSSKFIFSTTNFGNFLNDRLSNDLSKSPADRTITHLVVLAKKFGHPSVADIYTKHSLMLLTIFTLTSC